MQWFDDLLRYCLWFIMFIGIWLILQPLLVPNIKKMKLGLQFKKVKRKKINPVSIHIRKILGAALNQSSEYAISTFYFISLIFGFITFVALYKNGWEFTFILIYTITASSLPYLLLNIRVHMVQVNTSYEGGPVLGELLNNYKIYHKNINTALEVTIENLEHYESSKKVLNRLASQLLDYESEEELKIIIEDFQYSLGTKWGNLLGNLIYNAALYGDDIEEGIADIIKGLHKLDQINEKYKQTNIEGELMFFIVIPGMVLGSLYATFKMFGFSLQKFLDYQFINQMGFSSFMYTVSSIILCIIIYLYMKRSKNDF